MSTKRVLIFDSGVGGLSVYDEIIKLNPSIKCHYLFDNAYFPYGELPRRKLVSRLIQLLADFMAEYPTDLVVIACNSASTIALEDLRQHFSVPIVGVVPAIKPATNNTKNNVIGLLATPATIQRVYTTQLINQFAHGKTVLRIGSTALVKLAEDKLIGKAVLAADFKAVLKPWLSNEADMPDTIVLGCTHFPLIKHEIAACFTRPICLVDSGQAIAERVKQLLVNDSNNINNSDNINYSDNKANECLSPRPQQAFYTKHFIDKKHLASLQQSFADYGFKQVIFCDI